MTNVIIDEGDEMGKNLLNFLEKFRNEDFIKIEKDQDAISHDQLKPSEGEKKIIRFNKFR